MDSILTRLRQRLLQGWNGRSPASSSAPGATNQLADKLPQWHLLLEQDWARWVSSLESARRGPGPRVLIATSAGGFYVGTLVESLLAVALTLRGARVEVLLCDGVLPLCIQANRKDLSDEVIVREGIHRALCQTCYAPAENMYRSLGLPVHRYSALVSSEARAQSAQTAASLALETIGEYSAGGISIGEHALAGALRYYARGTLDGEALGEPILRKYLEAGLVSTQATRALLESSQFDVAVFNHGIYVPYGLTGEVARQENVRVVNWNPAYRKQTFVFSHHDTYHRTFLAEPVSNWEGLAWNQEMDHEIVEYISSRAQGTRDWIWFFEKPQEEVDAIARELGLDFAKPTIGLLTNVMWDAQLHFRANAFPSMLDWTLRTIQYFAGRPELQLVIRIHPAESRGTLPSRQPLLPEIIKAFPELPKNVFVIPPESQISTYAVMLQCNAAIIYGTKAGVELTCLGLPIIVAGEAYIRNKGITLDAGSPEEYFRILDRLPFPNQAEVLDVPRARKYAYHFFFRRMIPLEMFEPVAGWPPYRVRLSGLDDLLPGRSLGLDVVCDGILTGREFIYPAETVVRTPA